LDTLSLKQMAETVSSIGGLPEPRIVPFPLDRKPIDIGSYRTDNRRIQRELGWKPKVRFPEGIRLTRDYFETDFCHYMNPEVRSTPCRMQEHSGAPHRLEYTPI
jgi:UDP-glucose 4-epimerase